MDLVALKVIRCILNMFAMALHIMGGYLLVRLYKTGTDKAEIIYLINLSISETFVSFCSTLSIILSSIDSEFFHKLEEYTSILNHYGFCIMYYVCMILLMIDRSLEVILGIKYQLYCNGSKAFLSAKIAWGITIVITTIIALLYAMHQTCTTWHPEKTFLLPIYNILFALVAAGTYVFIAHKYRMSKKPPKKVPIAIERGIRALVVGENTSNDASDKIEVEEHVFRMSDYRTALALSVSFLLLVVIPDLCYPLGVSKYYGRPSPGHQTTIILFGIGMISDALIYMLMVASIRKMVAAKFMISFQYECEPDFFL